MPSKRKKNETRKMKKKGGGEKAKATLRFEVNKKLKNG